MKKYSKTEYNALELGNLIEVLIDGKQTSLEIVAEKKIKYVNPLNNNLCMVFLFWVNVNNTEHQTYLTRSGNIEINN